MRQSTMWFRPMDWLSSMKTFFIVYFYGQTKTVEYPELTIDDIFEKTIYSC